MTDIFQEVSINYIPSLVEVFKQSFENYYPFCQYVEIMGEYNNAGVKNPKQTLYRYGSLRTGVYLFEAHFDLGDMSYTIFHIFTANTDNSDLEEALSKTERIPWFSTSYVFQATLKRFAPIIRKVAKYKGVNLNGVEEDLLWLPLHKSLLVSEVPEDLELKFLNPIHAELMDKQWKFKFAGSNRYLGIQIANNFGLGLFRKPEAKMLCSAVTYNSGGIFCLFTDPESRGKGYGEIIVRSLAKELHSRQKVPFATVQRENIPSQRVFEKIGFEVFSVMEFISPPNYYKDFKPVTVKS
ncbi:uncharacterized protein LOC129001864 [Macrosteles quadrilineatus]|uniref:uncharacterized protein LOC129001864 n=1 Tax=Macrosteles quadrilineatus TaxID=74068 RepID=UPI0023E210B1|nr:uncharacterized protein LOC129001864 [Macrosteles quadrilineatus]